ncbi:hypothetical protein [Streptosporangium carneum]|uniref:Uncharacterized protein n=1 Tax=Streptosporangium carneum TaxID=47481 RepID=A0A9W6I6D6_9ACTN|nr:hypothetical protein [Streptosporangium carneum]GLK12074.1 hypothetical protein GCM10017600_54820 [Streptosporangium carneum]
MSTTWNTRPETGGDVAAVREVNLSAFPTPMEADLVEAMMALVFDETLPVPSGLIVYPAPFGV